MFKTLFGDVRKGRVGRLAFLGWSALLTAISVAIVLGIGFGAGIAENLFAADAAEAQAQIAERLGLPALLLFAIAFGAIFFADLNLTAKRFRDIGLPGWWLVLAVVLLSMAIATTALPEAASGLHLLVFVVLCLVPTGALAGRRQAAGAGEAGKD